MSTRCQIGFYEKESTPISNWQALIYRHCDGYPDGVLPDITPVLEEFDQKRGLDDLEYASAWLVAKLKDGVTNIGISKGFHGDLEYFYHVSPTAIRVFEGFGDPTEMKEMKKKKHIFSKLAAVQP